MKRFGLIIFCVFLVISLNACFSYQVKPFPINAKTENLNINPSSKLPLKVAVVIPDPLGTRLMYTPPNSKKPPMDQTDQMHGDQVAMVPLARELAKVSIETFSQVFDQAILFRQLPPPGEYDAVIQIRISSINTIGYMKGPFNAWQDVSLDWKLSVLDNQGIELIDKKDMTPAKKLVVKGSFSMDPWINSMSALLSEQLTELGKQWGLMLYSSPELEKYQLAKQKK
jgi:hypothetical protein